MIQYLKLGRIHWAILIPIAILIDSCDQSLYPGYSVTDTGLHYQIHFLGDGEQEAQKDDLVLANVWIKDLRDSLLYSNAMLFQQSAFRITPLMNGGLNEAFSLMSEGDSASFIMEGARLDLDELSGKCCYNGIHPEYKIDIRINRLLSPEQQNMAFKKSNWAQDMEMNEQILLNNFLKEKGLGKEDFVEGIYYVEHEEGEGHKIEGWETVKVRYQGSFVSGDMFDDTYLFRDPLEFELGKPEQVIDGFLIGMKQMRVGGQASFVIPSQLAFGEEGSSTGIVPPFTTVVYDVELVGIK